MPTRIIPKSDPSLLKDWQSGIQSNLSTQVVIPNKIEPTLIPQSKQVPTPLSISIRDKRRMRATTGEPLNTATDSKSGDYPTPSMIETIKQSKRLGVDPYTALAVNFQESKFGKMDSENPGHIVKQDFSQPSGEADLVNTLANKMKEGSRLGYKDEARQIQMYNGMGTLTADTDKQYNIDTGQGAVQKKWYGVPIPASGTIKMKDNPLYGKEIIDIRDNILKQDPNVKTMVDTTSTPRDPRVLGFNKWVLKYKK